jgi:hypothetical protein
MTGYNGWANYQTWNVVLWMFNDMGYYHTAQNSRNYDEFINNVDTERTQDNVRWDDPRVDHQAVNDAILEAF